MNSSRFNEDEDVPPLSDRPGGVKFTFRDPVGREAALNQYRESFVEKTLQGIARDLGYQGEVEQCNPQELTQYISNAIAQISAEIPVGTVIMDRQGQHYRITSKPYRSTEGAPVVDIAAISDGRPNLVPLYFFRNGGFTVIEHPKEGESESSEAQIREMVAARLKDLLRESDVDFSRIESVTRRLVQTIFQKQRRQKKAGKEPQPISVDPIIEAAMTELLYRR